MSAIPISSLFGSAGGGFYEQLPFATSGSFTAPNDGLYLLSAIGGGAAGTASGRGGCAGGFAQKLVFLRKGEVISFTIGAGGLTTGQAGGTTTLTAPGVSLTASGGTAAAGGAATGGDTNRTGGASNPTAGSGGGAVNLYGITYATNNSQAGNGVGSPAVSSPARGGSAMPANTGGSGNGGGRILLPVGTGGLSGLEGGPGAGGGINGGAGGMFGGGSGGSTPGAGGSGAGGGGGSSTTVGLGGVGLVVIEFYRS